MEQNGEQKKNNNNEEVNGIRLDDEWCTHLLFQREREGSWWNKFLIHSWIFVKYLWLWTRIDGVFDGYIFLCPPKIWLYHKTASIFLAFFLYFFCFFCRCWILRMLIFVKCLFIEVAIWLVYHMDWKLCIFLETL